jgi:hypothetical protein
MFRVQSVAMNPGSVPAPAPAPARARPSLGGLLGRAVLHVAFVFVAIGCFLAYEHFKVEGRSDMALASLVAAALFALAPLRDILRIVFRVEGTALHVAHGLGGLALVGLPFAGIGSGTPMLTHTAMAPFAIMGVAQALMHQRGPRNAAQAAAMQRFAASLPELAQVSGRSFSSPENARRAVAAVSDVLARAQVLGATELRSDPGFQGALRQVSARFGANLGLDAVDLALGKLAANPATSAAVPALRKQLATARRSVAAPKR